MAMSMLLILLARGWKVRFHDIDSDDGLDIYIPLAAMIVLIEVMIAALTFVDVDASHKYHDFGGMQGIILVIMRMLIYTGFLICLLNTKEKVKKH